MKTVIKSIFSALALSMFIVSTSFAQDTQTDDASMQDDTYQQDDRYTTQDGMETQDTQDPAQANQNENKTQIAQEELPTDVTEAIENSEYADWTVAEAYEVEEQDETTYEIHFENPQGQTEKEKFRKNGEVAR